MTWRKSARSGGNGGGCVEVATHMDQVMVRDSKDQTGPTLAVNAAEWVAFLRGLHR